jgi:hypothetical protein
MSEKSALKLERERNTFLQYKAECWRNVSISLVDAIESNNPSNIEKAIEQFEEVKGMFPYSEILIKYDF